MNRVEGLLLTEEGKRVLQKNLGGEMKPERNSEFNEALTTLCEQMNLQKGTISEEGQMTTCPVHYSLSSTNGFYSTQVVGTVVGTPDEVVCYLMQVTCTPLLKTHTSAHIGNWNENLQQWVFGER